MVQVELKDKMDNMEKMIYEYVKTFYLDLFKRDRAFNSVLEYVLKIDKIYLLSDDEIEVNSIEELEYYLNVFRESLSFLIDKQGVVIKNLRIYGSNFLYFVKSLLLKKYFDVFLNSKMVATQKFFHPFFLTFEMQSKNFVPLRRFLDVFYFPETFKVLFNFQSKLAIIKFSSALKNELRRKTGFEIDDLSSPFEII